MTAIDDVFLLHDSREGTRAQNYNQKELWRWNEIVNRARPQAQTSFPKLNVLTVNDDGRRPDPTTGANAPVPEPAPGGSDKDVLPIPTDFTQSLTKLTNGTSSDQNTMIQQLGQPLNAAVTIWQNWHHYNLDQFDWTQPPPASLPQELQDAIKFVQSNPALMSALKGEGGQISITSVIHFTMAARSDLQQAADDFAAWQKANPNAGPMATELAQSAAIIEANNTLLGGQYSAQDLQNFASQNPGLSPSLTGAAKMWAQPGMLHFLDQAGQNILDTSPDGLVNGGNIGAWLTSGWAPGSDADAINFINAAAARGPVSGIDTSGLDWKIFVHPDEYTGAQKAAALQELLDTQAKLQLASGGQVLDVQTQLKDGINPNMNKTNADLQSRIDTLRKDPDVQAFLNQNTPLSLQAIVNADPDMKAALNASYQKFQSGSMLNDDFNMKDTKGNPISQADGLHMFIDQAGFFQLANGQDGKMGDAPDLTAIAKNSGNYQNLLNYFNSNVASAKDLSTFLNKDAVNGGSEFTQEAEDYTSVLDPADAKAGGSSLLDNVDNTLFGNLTFDQLIAVMGDGNGNIDDTKLDNLIAQLEQHDPSISGSPQDPKTTAGQVFTIIKDIVSSMRLGTQFSVAYNNLFDGRIPTGTLKNWAKIGVLHGVNSFFGAIAIGLGGKPPKGDPAEIANIVGQAMGPAGQILNTAGRIYNYFTIKAAQGNLDEAQKGLTKAEGNLGEPKRKKETADSALTGAKKEVDEAKAISDEAKQGLVAEKKKLDEAKANHSVAKGNLKTAQKEEDEAQNKLDGALSDQRTAEKEAEAANDKAQGLERAKNAAKSEFDKAETEWKAKPTDKNKAAREQARGKLEVATTHSLEAKQQAVDADEKVAAAKSNVATAEGVHKEASAKVAGADKEVKRTDREVRTANGAVTDADKKVKKADDAVAKAQENEGQASADLTEAEDNVKKAEAAITEAKKTVEDAQNKLEKLGGAKNPAPDPAGGDPASHGDGSGETPDPAGGDPASHGDGSGETPDPAGGDPASHGDGSGETPDPAGGDPASHGDGSGETPEPVGGDPASHGDGTGKPKTKAPPIPHLGPAFGETVSGGGGIIGGVATIFDAKAHPGNTELQNLNYASAAFSLLSGTADATEGLLLLFGRGATPFLGSTLGEWASLIDGATGVVGAFAGFGITIAQMVLGLKKEHDTDVRDTHNLNETLKKYGVSGGPITPKDILDTGPVGQGLTPPPNSNSPGNAPPQGPSQSHSD